MAKAVSRDEINQVKKDFTAVGERILWNGWISKLKGENIDERLLVIGEYRFVTYRKALTSKKLQVARDGHYYTLKKICYEEERKLLLITSVFKLLFVHEDRDTILKVILQAYQDVRPEWPAETACVMEFTHNGQPVRAPDLERNVGPCSGFATVYRSFCVLYSIPMKAHEDFINSVLDRKSRELDISVFTPNTDDPTATLSLKPLIGTMLYNKWFTSVVATNMVRKDIFAAFAAVFTKNTHCTSLVLSGTGAVSGAKAFGKNIGTNLKCALRDVDMSFNNLGDKVTNTIMRGCSHLRLRSLALAGVDLKPKGVAAVVKTIAESSIINTLTALDLSHNRVGTQGSRSLRAMFEAGRFKGLLALMLGNTNVDIAKLGPAIRLEYAPALLLLDLSQNSFNTKASNALASFLPGASITELDLAYCKVSQDSLKFVVEALVFDPARRICTLRLDKVDLGARGAQLLSSVAERATNLYSVTVNDTKMGLNGLSILANGLAAGGTLRRFSCSRVAKKGKPAAMTTAVDSLVRLIHGVPLETLVLSGTEKMSFGEYLTPLCHSLARHETMRELDLSGQRFGDTGARALAESIKNMPALEYLAIDENMVTADGLRFIALSICINRTLTEMVVPHKDLKRLLVSMRKQKHSRQREDVKEAVRKMHNAIKRNREGGAYETEAEDRSNMDNATASTGTRHTIAVTGNGPHGGGAHGNRRRATTDESDATGERVPYNASAKAGLRSADTPGRANTVGGVGGGRLPVGPPPTVPSRTTFVPPSVRNSRISSPPQFHADTAAPPPGGAFTVRPNPPPKPATLGRNAGARPSMLTDSTRIEAPPPLDIPTMVKAGNASAVAAELGARRMTHNDSNSAVKSYAEIVEVTESVLSDSSSDDGYGFAIEADGGYADPNLYASDASDLPPRPSGRSKPAVSVSGSGGAPPPIPTRRSTFKSDGPPPRAKKPPVRPANPKPNIQARLAAATAAGEDPSARGPPKPPKRPPPPHSNPQTPTSDDAWDEGGAGAEAEAEEGGAYHYPAGGEESADGEWVVDDSFRQQRGNSAAEELNAVYGEYVDLYEQDGAASGADGDDTGDGWDEDEDGYYDDDGNWVYYEEEAAAYDDGGEGTSHDVYYNDGGEDYDSYALEPPARRKQTTDLLEELSTPSVFMVSEVDVDALLDSYIDNIDELLQSGTLG